MGRSFRWADDGRIAWRKINARIVLFDEAVTLWFGCKMRTAGPRTTTRRSKES